jgi:hypothetical protein
MRIGHMVVLLCYSLSFMFPFKFSRCWHWYSLSFLCMQHSRYIVSLFTSSNCTHFLACLNVGMSISPLLHNYFPELGCLAVCCSLSTFIALHTLIFLIVA